MQRKIEAILVCIDFGDILSEIIVHNAQIFDNYIVVTEKEDLETQEICKQHSNITCVISNNKNKGGAVFNKGALLNDGVNALKYKDIIVFTDADVFFPDDFREKIPWDSLKPNVIYGGNRKFCWTYEQFLSIVKQNKFNDLLSIAGYGVGFLQILLYDRATIKYFERYGGLYPESDSCDNVDIEFLKRFHPDVKTVGKLDIDVICLSPHGIFHCGRKNSKISELRGIRFRNMPDVSSNIIYK